jgi:hypothetical protein
MIVNWAYVVVEEGVSYFERGYAWPRGIRGLYKELVSPDLVGLALVVEP